MIHNYRVKSELFKNMLTHLQKGEPVKKDVQKIMDLHLISYDRDFRVTIENYQRQYRYVKTNAEKD